MSGQPMPKGWTTGRVGDLVKLDNGFAFKPTDWKKAGLPIIRIQNLNNPDAAFNYCDREVPERVFVAPGDLLFAWSGTPGTSFGAHIWRGERAVLNQHIFNVRFDDTATDRKFLRLAINQNLDEYIRAAHGGAGLAHITKGRFEESNLLLPPLPEQRRIVAKIEELFSDLDAGVAALERVRANLKRYRAAVLKAAVEGRLTEEWRKRNPVAPEDTATKLLERILLGRRAKWEQDQLRKFKEAGKTPPKGWKEKYKEPPPAETKDLADIPSSWRWASIEQLSTKVVDGVHRKPNYVASGVPFVTVRNLTAGSGISFEKLNYVTEADHMEFSKRTDVQRGDILISKDGTLGVVRVVRTDAPFSIFVSVALVKPVSYDLSDYFGLAMSSLPVQRQMVPKGSGLQHIHLDDLRCDAVPLPPVAEQSAIVAEVDRRLSVADAAEQQVEHALQRAARLRQAILKRAFEGKLVEQDPTDEPAAALIAPRVCSVRTKRTRARA